jgi:iron complex outermembrane recepter protein
MRTFALLLAGSAIAVAAPAYATDEQPAGTPAPATAPEQPHPEQTTPAPTRAAPVANDQDIVVTARKREESLKNVPVSATAITGDTIERRGLTSVKDAALLTPGLSINSDGAGRAFVSIRGVGVTLVDSVQPGVGIFLDGIYQPNTSYLNNPLVDVERVEVLRGPQGTLYGKNTLGGAINVITRQPSNQFHASAIMSGAGPDDSWFGAASVSGPIITDHLQARIAVAHRQQDGFLNNVTIDKPANPLNTDTVNGTVRFLPGGSGGTVLTVNGYYDWVKGGSVPYAFVTGPTDYNRTVRLNATNYQFFKYRGVNSKLEVPIDSISSKLTLIGAYDARDVNTPDADGDFTPVDILRVNGHDDLKTRTVEGRFDTQWSSTLSSIFGLFYSRETRDVNRNLIFFPATLGVTNTEQSSKSSNTYAVFGTLFWRPSDVWEVSAGLRWDEQKQKASGVAVAVFPNILFGLPPTTTVTNLKLNEKNLSPRFAVTRHWTKDFMTYASVARGSRGGGFNPPVVANTKLLTYRGDNVWTYELGTKYASADRRLSLAADVYYNDYKHYIGLNSIAPSITGSFTTIDLNTGDVRSYGMELEAAFRPIERWSLTGGVSLQHARLTNFNDYTAATGRILASKRLTFQPDWNFNVASDYVVPLPHGSDIDWNVNLVGKGSRIAASLSETVAPVLRSYVLVNSSVTFRHNGLEVGAFVDNLLNKNYFDSYIEKTTLILAGLPATDVGIPGDKRRIGIRARYRF